MHDKVINALLKEADREKAEILQRFFKTGKGEYAEGDLFLGIKVPLQRIIVRRFYREITLKENLKLMRSKYHESRLTGLLILVEKFKKAGAAERAEIFRQYIDNTEYINNWDLVDTTAPKIVGEYLLDKSREVLYGLAVSKSLWERRIAIMSTCTFIRNNDFEDALRISDILLDDDHDLIHKAVGWMLREIGNRDIGIEEGFLKSRYRIMPRMMLRYAIEKFPEKKRKSYLKN